MLNVNEENYIEAVVASYKVSVTPGISKLFNLFFLLFAIAYNTFT
jgi:hypothetical protein